jgi:hypothetical protein
VLDPAGNQLCGPPWAVGRPLSPTYHPARPPPRTLPQPPPRAPPSTGSAHVRPHDFVCCATTALLPPQVVFREGEDITDDSAFYIIMEGTVEVSTRRDAGTRGDGGDAPEDGPAPAPVHTVVRSHVLRQVWLQCVGEGGAGGGWWWGGGGVVVRWWCGGGRGGGGCRR